MKKPALNQEQLDKLEIERNLTIALKMVVYEFSNLGFDDRHILGLVNLILQDHVQDDGDFTPQYKAMASAALRQTQEEENSLKLILPNGIGGY
ncbi:hypothetical protein UFOVP94_25 [uncultured Caudovirales phage]|uniref:Uncharacterized protein n=1 Tax=uncultured Caudovirales phage TaxID=2100421 RepID=A0A6J5L6X1_9CAUD|nr:hypothetical protein UFOVP94_25 [uncultured Caudovirales phage]CAB5212460.1 hypothetical protein UFOVP186_18 [uncultured Caudovirales phage]